MTPINPEVSRDGRLVANRHDSRHLHPSECAGTEKEHKRMCFTVIIATMVIQKEQCAAEYHWQLRVPAITAKKALDGIEFFQYSADEITAES